MMKKIGTENRSLAIVIWRGEGEQEGGGEDRTEDGGRRRGRKTEKGREDGNGQAGGRWEQPSIDKAERSVSGLFSLVERGGGEEAEGRGEKVLTHLEEA